ncbi:AAA family ATPase [Nocardioides sp. JQ2195]|uniref:helix-turn-helix transcriptional regulator n=1 Tax=Nocardioides sp. JQ2195 TaxID=2592334 RepID=UPI00143E6D80|nr:LuxR family transcriptional regulator [Nocardioides sp. JQ2195]QIX28097.1 AAA family ATPase [Nocardioides sp. JQ2195]
MTTHFSGHVFVGRSAELESLRQLAATTSGRPSIVVVEGPPGSGKTALVEEFLAVQSAVTVLRAGASEWESAHPYAVLEQLDVAPDPADDPVVVARALLPELRRRTAGDGRLFIVVDGADLADAASLKALHSAARRAPTTIRVVMTARNPIRVDLPDLRRLRISELSTSDVRQLGQQHGVALTDREARALRDHAAGNAGVVIELLAEAPETPWTDWQRTLPATRRRVAEVRLALESCSPVAQRLLAAAAVLGDDAAEDEAIRLADVDEDSVSALDSAEEARLLHRDLRLGSKVLHWVDPMTRSAVLELVGMRRSHELHARAVEVVEDEFRLLHHRVLADREPNAALLVELREFAERQSAEGAWRHAAHALVRASRMEPDRARAMALLVEGVDALIGAGELPEANLFVEELEVAPRSARIDATLAYLSILRGRPAEAELLLDRAWQSWDTARPEVRSLIGVRRVLHHLAMWQPDAMVEWSDRVSGTGSPDATAALESAAMRGIGLAACGRWDEALASYDELGHRVPTGPQAQRIRMGRGWIDLARDEPVSARHDFEGAVPTRFRMGSTRVSLWAQAWLARSLFRLGDWDEALAVVARASREVAESEHHLLRPLVHWTGVQVNVLRGDQAAAREHLRKGAAAAQDYPMMQIPAALARAHFAEGAANYEGVVQALSPVAARLGNRIEPGFWPWPALHANALVMTDRVSEARALIDAHHAVARERGHRSEQAALEAVLGRIHCGSGDLDAGVAAFESALELLSDLPLPFERARVNFSYGQSLRRAGRRREADGVMRSARDGYATLRATTYVERCDRELNAAGLHTRRTTSLTDLTPQETAVADLVASGLSNREASEQLYISVKTVQYHLTRIYAKLGIRSRTELAARHVPTSEGSP